MAIACFPGSRSKVAVYNRNGSVDAVGAVIGRRGDKIEAVTQEMHGERVDIIEWSSNPVEFLKNALKNITIQNVRVEQNDKKIYAVLPSDKISIAIGRGGQNVKLLSRLIDWDVHFVTEEEESQSRVSKFQTNTEKLRDTLNIEDVMAELLVVEGYLTVESIVDSPSEDLMKIEGFDEDIVLALKSRAEEVLKDKISVQGDLIKKLEEFNLPNNISSIIVNNDIATIEDFADLSIDDLKDLLPRGLEINEEEVSQSILKAREKVYG
jgi:N utilization substance protein A